MRLSRVIFMPARRDSAISASRGGEGGLRPVALPVVAGAAEDADDLAEVLERLVRAVPDHAGGPADLGGGRVGAEFEGARVDAEHSLSWGRP